MGMRGARGARGRAGSSRTCAVDSAPSRNSAVALRDEAAHASTCGVVVHPAAVLAAEERILALLGVLLPVHKRRGRVLRHLAAAGEETSPGIRLDVVLHLCVLPRRLGCAVGGCASWVSRADVAAWRRKRVRRGGGVANLRALIRSVARRDAECSLLLAGFENHGA